MRKADIRKYLVDEHLAQLSKLKDDEPRPDYERYLEPIKTSINNEIVIDF